MVQQSYAVIYVLVFGVIGGLALVILMILFCKHCRRKPAEKETIEVEQNEIEEASPLTVSTKVSAFLNNPTKAPSTESDYIERRRHLMRQNDLESWNDTELVDTQGSYSVEYNKRNNWVDWGCSQESQDRMLDRIQLEPRSKRDSLRVEREAGWARNPPRMILTAKSQNTLAQSSIDSNTNWADNRSAITVIEACGDRSGQPSMEQVTVNVTQCEDLANAQDITWAHPSAFRPFGTRRKSTQATGFITSNRSSIERFERLIKSCDGAPNRRHASYDEPQSGSLKRPSVSSMQETYRKSRENISRGSSTGSREGSLRIQVPSRASSTHSSRERLSASGSRENSCHLILENNSPEGSPHREYRACLSPEELRAGLIPLEVIHSDADAEACEPQECRRRCFREGRSPDADPSHSVNNYERLWQLRSTLEHDGSDEKHEGSLNVGASKEKKTLEIVDRGAVLCHVICERSGENSGTDSPSIDQGQFENNLLQPPEAAFRRQTFQRILNSRSYNQRGRNIDLNSSTDKSFDSFDTSTTEGFSSESSKVEMNTTSFESSTTNDSESFQRRQQMHTGKDDSGYKSLEAAAVSPTGRNPISFAIDECCDEGSSSRCQSNEAQQHFSTRSRSRTASGRRRDFGKIKLNDRYNNVITSCSSFELDTTDSNHLSGDSFDDTCLPGASHKSSAFLRFFQSNSRRGWRHQAQRRRDYSVDAQTDALYKEFLRYDPQLEGRRKHVSRRSCSNPTLLTNMAKAVEDEWEEGRISAMTSLSQSSQDIISTC